MVQATPFNPTVFVQIQLHSCSVRSHVSQFCLNVCTRIEASSTNGRKQVAWDDVAIKAFPLPQSSNLKTQSTHSNIGMLNM